MNVAVLGASNKPHRYSYQVITKLLEAGHNVFPVHPHFQEIQGLAVYPSLTDIKETMDTLTVYVNSQRSSALQGEILLLNPKRIILNPGAENQELAEIARNAGIKVQEACTLVLLATGQF